MRKATISYEELTVRVPKTIFDFLEKHKTVLEITPQRYAEESIIEMLRTDINSNEVFRQVPQKIRELLS